VLDEPTNHLDLEAIEALVEGLAKYDGTLLFVSHDRWFVSKLANRIVEIGADGIRDFQGSYDEYVERCGDDHLDAEVVLARARQEKRRESAARKAGVRPDPDAQKRSRELARRRDQLTAEIDRAEKRVHEINELFCNPGFFDKTAPKEIQKLENEQKRLAGEVEAKMAEWERLESELAASS